jgi:hypothetical protein
MNYDRVGFQKLPEKGENRLKNRDEVDNLLTEGLEG